MFDNRGQVPKLVRLLGQEMFEDALVMTAPHEELHCKLIFSRGSCDFVCWCRNGALSVDAVAP